MQFHFLKLLLPILTVLLSFSPDSQISIAPKYIESIQTALDCGHDEQLDYLLQSDPKTAEALRKLEEDYQQHIAQQSFDQRALTNYVLPVVVHIIHQNGNENISDTQVSNAIQQLNESFANMGYYDQGEGTTVPIQFCLALQDPNGAGTTGITRDVSPLTTLVYQNDDLNLKNINRWDPNCYINIWVVQEIISASSGSGVLGYAYLPSAHGQDNDGIVVEANFFGSSNANNVVLIHEMGHYLGLYHTFQGGCSNNDCSANGDRVCDTPPDQSTNPVTCSSTVNTCSTDTNSGFTTDQPDMFKNYMDYGDLPCYNSFTQGQSDRMEFFVSGVRSSLLACASCIDPCPVSLIANATASTQTTMVGDNVTLQASPTIPGTSWSWIFEGVEIGNTPSFNYTFNTPGIATVYLTVNNSANVSCIESDSIQIEVLCNVNAQFDQSTNECLMTGESIVFTNQSQNETNIAWYLNNVLVSTSEVFDTSFNVQGIYLLELSASNSICGDWTSTHLIHVGCLEVCDNGYDDDQDGLVDCFDPDCFCDSLCANYYYDPCTSLCLPPDPTFNFEMEEMWRNSTDFRIGTAAPVVVGDLDQDGFPEIFIQGHFWDDNKWYVLNGVDGTIKRSFDPPIDFPHFRRAAPLIGDVDLDGQGEVIYASPTGFGSTSSYYIHCYSMDGEGYISSDPISLVTPITSTYATPPVDFSLADFNQDGFPELYVANRIYSAQNGDLLASGESLTSYGTTSDLALWQSYKVFHSIAADLLPDDFCPDCEGLELLVGNQILSVNLNSGTVSIAQSTEDTDYGDGFSAITDFDADGDLDGVIISRHDGAHRIYVWDLQTNNIMHTYDIEDAEEEISSRLCIADFDGDGALEVAFSATEKLIVLDNDFSKLWENVIIDDLQIDPSPTAFDFNYDGAYEILLNDEESFFIFDGATGNVIYTMEDYPAYSSSSNYPVIADVDGDGQTEILMVFVETNPFRYVLGCYKSAGTPWAMCRPTWNQTNFYNHHTEDDLKVNPHMQSGALAGDGQELATYLAAYPIPFEHAPDAVAEGVTMVNCENGGLEFTITICNSGQVVLSYKTPYTVYDSDPTMGNPTLLFSGELDQNVNANECIDIVMNTPGVFNQEVFVMLNDDGSGSYPLDYTVDFPLSIVAECDYSNNMVSFEFEYNPAILDLGPDFSFCEFQVQSLNAGNSFDSYLWQDGSVDSIFTAWLPGKYWVDVKDVCGNVQTDTVVIEVFDDFVYELEMDTTLCEGDTIVLFDQLIYEEGDYSNSFSPTEGCDSMLTYSVIFTTQLESFEYFSICDGDSILIDGIWAFTTDIYQSFYSTSSDCDSVHTIDLTVLDNSLVHESISICEGDSTLVFGNWENVSGVYENSYPSFNGCDSTHIINLSVLQNSIEQENWSICESDSILIFGNWENTSGTYEQSYTAFNNCDSTHVIELLILDNTLEADLISLCAGDSTFLFGEWISVAGTYESSYLSANGCDSTYVVTLEIENVLIQTENLSICAGDSISLFGSWENTAGNYQEIFPLASGCDSVQIYDLTVLDNSLVNESISICEGDSTLIFGNWENASGAYESSYPSLNGCDSTHIIDLMVLQNSIEQENWSICESDSILIFGNWENTSGTYEQSYTAFNNCDSIHVIELLILDNTLEADLISLCEGDSTFLFGEWISVAGTYESSYLSANGCDSTYVVTLEIENVITQSESLSICAGDSISLFGSWENTAGNYQEIFPLASGCDSVQIYDLTVLNNSLVNQNRTICAGDSTLVFGNWENVSGVYENSYPSFNGCDSTHIVDLTVLPNSIEQENWSICGGDSVLVFGNWENTSGTYEQSYTAFNSCDSIHVIELLVLESPLGVSMVSICEGDSTFLFGSWVSLAGTYEALFTDANGCDSIHQIDLTLLSLPEISYLTSSACDEQNNGTFELSDAQGALPFSYQWGHTNNTSPNFDELLSGDYQLTITDAEGCTNSLEIQIEEFLPPSYEIFTKDVDCNLENTGSIMIAAIDEDLLFSLQPNGPFQSEPVFNNLAANEYSIFIQDAEGCIYKTVANINFPLEEELSLPTTHQIFRGDSVQLIPIGNLLQAETYVWMPPTGLSCIDCPSPNASPGERTEYELFVTYLNGCVRSAVTYVEVVNANGIFVPNAFSPNDDSVNDFLKLYTATSVEVTYFRIFDRWGELVYEEKNTSTDMMLGWDGKLDGKQMGTGVFVYIAEVVLADGEILLLKGDFLILR